MVRQRNYLVTQHKWRQRHGAVERNDHIAATKMFGPIDQESGTIRHLNLAIVSEYFKRIFQTGSNATVSTTMGTRP